VQNVELQTSSIKIVGDIANYKSYMNYMKGEFEDTQNEGHDEEQTTQWPKEKEQRDKQRSSESILQSDKHRCTLVQLPLTCVTSSTSI
jgi:hypothetical protein